MAPFGSFECSYLFSAIVMASPIAEHGLQSSGSVVVKVQVPGCLAACGIFPKSESRSVVSNTFDSMDYSSGQNTGVGSLSLLQGIFPTQGLKPGFLHCRQILYQLNYQESPIDI